MLKAPPSNTSSAPVMYDDSSDAKNKTPWTTSSTEPARIIGTRDKSSSSASSAGKVARNVAESSGPGWTECSEFYLRVLRCHDLRENADRALAGGVSRFLGQCLSNPSNRRNVDDRTSTSITHCRNSGLGPEEHAFCVDRHDAIPFFLCAFFNRYNAAQGWRRCL